MLKLRLKIPSHFENLRNTQTEFSQIFLINFIQSFLKVLFRMSFLKSSFE